MRLWWRSCLLAAFSLADICSSVEAEGQEAGNVRAAPADIPDRVTAPRKHCTLHVWPSKDAHSSYAGWFHGGAVDGDRRGIKGYPAMHADLLSTGVQQKLLSGMDWRVLLVQPGLSVVVHAAPPAAQDDQARTTPLIPERPACYRELIVRSVLVERAALSSSTVRVIILAKSWDGLGAAPSNFMTMATGKIDLRNDPERSLRSGFVASVGKVLNSRYFQRN